jgi:hypothetical protein
VIDVEEDVLTARFLSAFGFDFDTFTLVKVPADYELRLTQIEFVAGGLRLAWDSLPGLSYQIQWTDNLTAPAWAPASGFLLASGRLTTWLLPVSGNLPMGFYRVVRVGGQ